MQLSLFEETLVVIAIEAKGEPWYINSGASKHVIGSVEALNHVNAFGYVHNKMS
jgi:hypothetical protein